MTNLSYKSYSISIKLWKANKVKNFLMSIILTLLNARKLNRFTLIKMSYKMEREVWKNILVLTYVVNFLQVPLVVPALMTLNLLTLFTSNLALVWTFTSILWNILLPALSSWQYLLPLQLDCHASFLQVMESIHFSIIKHFSFQRQWVPFHRDTFTVNMHLQIKLLMGLMLRYLTWIVLKEIFFSLDQLKLQILNKLWPIVKFKDLIFKIKFKDFICHPRSIR